MGQRRLTTELVRGLGSSGIRRAFDLAATMRNPINLSIGQPDFEVPEAVKAAITQAVRENRNGYTPTRGLAALRERLAEQLRAEIGVLPDVFMTSGVSGGLFLALLACVDAGDEVLFADPYFVSYPQLVRLSRGVPVAISTYDDFQLDPKSLEKAVTPRTKAIIIASPGNPTGVTYGESLLRDIAEVAHRHDLLIISDEIYNMLCYDGRAASVAKFAPDRTIVLRGFGKSHAMTGLRIAYAAGPTEIISEMAKLQQYTYVCSPHPAQWGALAALDVDMSAQVAAYRAKRNLVCRELQGSFDFVRPTGGFYVFPRAPKKFKSASEMFENALKHELLIIAGEVFSARDTHFRISYAVPDEKIRQGCAILRELAG